MGNNQTQYKDREEMKPNNKPPPPVEEDSTEKRKASAASVDEIRDLYSALQELVPSTQQPPSPVPEPEKETNCPVPQSGLRRNPAPLIQPKRSSSPLPSRTQPRVAPRRNRSYSLDAQMGFPNFSEQIPRRDYMWGFSQRKRLLKKSRRMHEELHTIIKDFDEAEINGSRNRSRSLNILLESTGSSEEQCAYDHARSRSFTDVCEEQTICEIDGGVLEKADHNSEKNELKNNLSENLDDVNYLISKKRLSAGDILGQQRRRLSDPQSLCRRGTIGGSLLLNAIVSSASTSSTKRRGSLASALNLIAHKNELQELIKNCQDKLSKEELNNNQNRADETDHGNTKPEVPEVKPQQTANSSDLQKEVDILLASIKELQQHSGTFDIDQDSCEDFQDTRRASVASVGTEMHNLLEALSELMVCTGEETPNSTPSGSTTSSRRTSISDIRAGAQNESLEELEAYFKYKLEDISEGDTSSGGRSKSSKERKKAPSYSKTQENLTGIGSRRHSAPKVKDKANPAKSPVLPSKTTLLHTSNSVDLLKPLDAFRVQRHTGQHVGSRNGSRRRSLSAHDIDLPERTERMLANELRISNRSPCNSSPRLPRQDESNVNIDPVQAQSRALWKEDQLKFADQVNKRLQDWLERATAMSLQEGEETKIEDHTLKVDHLLVVSSDNEPVICKTKKTTSRFAMKKVFRKTIRRSKSVNNLSVPEPEPRQKSPRFRRGNRKKVKRSKSLQSIHDHDEMKQTKPKSKPHILRSPQNLLKIGRQRLLRSKSFHNVSIKPSLDSLERRATESDESFDDGHSTYFIRRNLSCESSEQNQSFDSLDVESDNHEASIRPSCPKTTDENSTKLQIPNGTEKSLRLFVNGKRISRFPVNLPLFYAPGSDVSTLHAIKDERCSQHLENTKQRNERRSLLLSKGEANHGLFYDEKHAPAIALATPAFPGVFLSPVPSKEMNMSRPCSVSDEGYIKSPSQEVLNDSSTFSDFTDLTDNFRDRAKSTESEDSGCPNIIDI